MSKEQLSGELLDIVDLTGEPTGRQEDKAIIHRDGLWHRDVHVWITNGTHFLEQQRAWGKAIMEGQWDISASGHVGIDESYEDAALRETGEELGLFYKKERLIPIGRMAIEMVMDDGMWTHRVVGDNFVVVERNLTEANLQDMLTLQTSEVIGARLYDLDQLEDDLRHPARAGLHAEQPGELWELGINGMREALAA
jgi:isopentenyldiphosphate isomerase